MRSLEPRELALWRAEGRALRLIDVREAVEWDQVRLEGAELRPLSELGAWLPALLAEPGPAPLVVLCHHGVRSARVCGLLRQGGATAVWNLRGGLDAYAREVDASIGRY